MINDPDTMNQTGEGIGGIRGPSYGSGCFPEKIDPRRRGECRVGHSKHENTGGKKKQKGLAAFPFFPHDLSPWLN